MEDAEMEKKKLICFILMLIMFGNSSIKLFHYPLAVQFWTRVLEKWTRLLQNAQRKAERGVRKKLKFIIIFHQLFLLITTFLIFFSSSRGFRSTMRKHLTFLQLRKRWAKLNKNYKSINFVLNLICLPFLKQFLCYISSI